MIIPPLLESGDSIGLVAPSGPVTREQLKPAIRYFADNGHPVRESNHLYACDRYLAGSDEDRISDIHAMFSDPEIKAIVAARGGYGSARILDRLDYDLIRENPKVLTGFSDTTALQLAIYTKTGLISYSGFMPKIDFENRNLGGETENSLWNAIRDSHFDRVSDLQILKPGSARGELLPGCLSIIVSMLGTSYLPSLEDKILVLEDVNEDNYKLDRMLTQLRLSGILDQLSGLIFGQFTSDDETKTLSADQLDIFA